MTELHISNIGKAFGITSLKRGLFRVTAVHIVVQIVVNPICKFLAHKTKRALNRCCSHKDETPDETSNLHTFFNYLQSSQ